MSFFLSGSLGFEWLLSYLLPEFQLPVPWLAAFMTKPPKTRNSFYARHSLQILTPLQDLLFFLKSPEPSGSCSCVLSRVYSSHLWEDQFVRSFLIHRLAHFFEGGGYWEISDIHNHLQRTNKETVDLNNTVDQWNLTNIKNILSCIYFNYCIVFYCP